MTTRRFSESPTLTDDSTEAWWLCASGDFYGHQKETEKRMRREIPRPAIQDYFEMLLKAEEAQLRVGAAETPEQDLLEASDAVAEPGA